MRWALPVIAGLAGLLLGGPVVASVGVLLGHAAIRLRRLAREVRTSHAAAGDTYESRTRR
jgi:hypothetical protein